MFQRGHIAQDQRAVAAVEFAMAAPLLIAMMLGILQMSMMFFANAGLQQAVEAGARYATIYPSPSDAQIIAKVSARQFGLDASRITGPSVSHGTANGVKYVEVTMAYAMPSTFVFFQTSPLTLTHTRRAYQP